MNQLTLDRLAGDDPHLQQTPEFVLIGARNDPSHAERRCQQRGISLTKIRIALAYGRHDHHHGWERWTLVSRRLRRTPYERFEHDLNGLQLVGRRLSNSSDGGALVQLKTCKWSYRLRRH
ncbi:DUF4258 domain-containing protein [Cyanobium sp. CH-040]|uniref:DUF4258 domain-containing protein n=1 Tax=Cyanobium sp. CH-040 TaxID=2823708 RepID=UPI0020CE0477|nr:DUF4258 domain-containing protein [Cyanobium sp. CH-040]MCP9928838.1 DUF4258 domain-containing protein [Cyanobium sp. CH-040]